MYMYLMMDDVLSQLGRNVFHLAAMKGHVDVVNAIILFNKSSAITEQVDRVSSYAYNHVNSSQVKEQYPHNDMVVM